MPRPPLVIVTLTLVVASTAWSQDVRPPSEFTPPSTAYARATADGKVTLRIPDVVRTPGPASATDPKKLAGSETVGWRVITVGLNDPSIKVRDVSGKPVAADRIQAALSKETPVLVSAGIVDRFHLLTTKEGTLVFTVPANLLPARRLATPSPEPVTAETASDSETESALLKLANAEREKAQVPALAASPILLKAARQHSANMVKQGKLEHQLEGKSVSDRLNDLGYAWRACGENIALGPRTPADAIRSWMESPGHRANLLSTDFTQIGVAMKADANGEPYWTMVLAAPR